MSHCHGKDSSCGWHKCDFSYTRTESLEKFLGVLLLSFESVLCSTGDFGCRDSVVECPSDF